jgi:hypothetical protein
VGAPAVNAASAGPKDHARHARHIACLRAASILIASTTRRLAPASATMRHAVNVGPMNRIVALNRIAPAARI